MTPIVHDWLTIKQAAEYIQVDPMTIWRWIKKGKLEATKTTAGYRISAEEIKRLMAVTNRHIVI